MRLKASQFEGFIAQFLQKMGDRRFVFCPQALTYAENCAAENPPGFVLLHRSSDIQIRDESAVTVIAIALANWCGTSLVATLYTLPRDESGEFVADALLGGQRISPHDPALAKFVEQFEKEFAEYGKSVLQPVHTE